VVCQRGLDGFGATADFSGSAGAQGERQGASRRSSATPRPRRPAASASPLTNRGTRQILIDAPLGFWSLLQCGEFTLDRLSSVVDVKFRRLDVVDAQFEFGQGKGLGFGQLDLFPKMFEPR
jgi:hypothetical protein